MTLIPNEECKTLVLTGASRGIGYAALRRPIELHSNGVMRSTTNLPRLPFSGRIVLRLQHEGL